ncbi:MAG TPA: TIM barrel protein [Candidatus Acidoferrum sp.]|jgi:hydroxypyruvate isomerase|nr:TIM barrel protein [Candidatus Acidoferrum sp.]
MLNRRDFSRSLAGAAAASTLVRFAGADALKAAPQAAAAGAVPFRFSVMLWTVFAGIPFDQRLEKVSEAGYKNVELTGEFGRWADDDFTKFNAKKHELGITFDATSGVRTGVADPSAGDKLIEEMKPFLDTMGRLECPTLILLSGNKIPDSTPDAQHNACIDNLGRAAELAATHKISIILENIDPIENPRYYLTSVAEGFQILRKLNNPNVKFLYDFYHEQIAEGFLIDKLQKNADITGVVHIADVPGRHEPGTGEINFANIYRALITANWTGTVAMEFRPTGDPKDPNRAAREIEALRIAREQAIQAATTK